MVKSRYSEKICCIMHQNALRLISAAAFRESKGSVAVNQSKALRFNILFEVGFAIFIRDLVKLRLYWQRQLVYEILRL